MKEKEKQLKYFKQRKQFFQITLQLTSQPQSFLITLTNEYTQDVFQRQIDQQYIDNYQQTKILFHSPKHLMNQMIAQFQNIKISSKGQISMCVSIGSQQRQIQIIICTDKKSIDKFDVISLKFENFKKCISALMIEKDRKIENLVEQNLLIQQKLIKQQQERIKMIEKLSFDPSHFQNPHWKYYSITKFGYNARIKHISENAWYNYICNMKIEQNRVTNYKVKIIQITDKNIAFGIGTKNIFGTANAAQKYCVSFYYCGNCYFQNTVNHPVVCNLKNGDNISVQIDRIQNIVKWRTNDIQIASTIIPQFMRLEQMFLLIELNYKYDEVELIL